MNYLKSRIIFAMFAFDFKIVTEHWAFGGGRPVLAALFVFRRSDKTINILSLSTKLKFSLILFNRSYFWPPRSTKVSNLLEI